MLDPKRISELPFLTSGFSSQDLFVVVQNGVTYRINYGTLIAGLGGPQALNYNALGKSVSISGGNSISIDPVNLSISVSGSFQLPAERMIDKIVVDPTGDQNLSIGTTPSGTEIIQRSLVDSVPLVLSLTRYSRAGETIYFTASNVSIKIYLL